MNHSPSPAHLLGASFMLALLLGLSACAPEPASVAGQTEKGSEATNTESSWGQPSEEFDPEAKSTELPPSFPLDSFPIPKNAVIDDAGAREENAWFVVFLASDQATASSLWSEVIAQGNFEESEVGATAEGGTSATLQNNLLIVTAVTISNTDGSVLMSYDIRTAVA